MSELFRAADIAAISAPFQKSDPCPPDYAAGTLPAARSRHRWLHRRYMDRELLSRFIELRAANLTLSWHGSDPW